MHSSPAWPLWAGPGTGKTKNAHRVVHCMADRTAGRVPGGDYRRHLYQPGCRRDAPAPVQADGRRAAARLTIGTFLTPYAGAFSDVRLVSRGEALELAADVLKEEGRKMGPAALVQAVSRINGAAPEAAGISPKLFEAYQSRPQQLGMLDFDDLLTQALKLDVAGTALLYPPAGG